MTQMMVNLPEREGFAARRIGFNFTHPWRETTFRGMRNVMVKTSVCIVGELRKEATATEKARFRFYGMAQAKWPLIAPKVNGQWSKARTVCTLPKEQLSRVNGAKQALKAALKLCADQFTYEERIRIWEQFHRTFRTGIVPDSPFSPPEQSVALVLHPTHSTVAAVKSPEGHMIVSHHSWPSATSNVVH